MSGDSRRAYPRVPRDDVGIVQLRQGRWIDQAPYVCKIKDLSAEGICFETDDIFEVHSGILVTFMRHGSSDRLVLYGEVMWKSDASVEEKRYGAKLYTSDYQTSEELYKNVEAIRKCISKQKL